MNVALGPIIGHFSTLEELITRFLFDHPVIGGLFLTADEAPELLILRDTDSDTYYLMQNTAHPRRPVFLPQDVWSCDDSIFLHDKYRPFGNVAAA